MKNIDRYDEEAQRLDNAPAPKKRTKKKERVEVSEYNPVPLYRSYGKTRREYKLFEEIKIFLEKLTGAMVVGGPVLIVATGIIAVLVLGPLTVKLTVALAVTFALAERFTRIARKRARFISKLKKQCKVSGAIFNKENPVDKKGNGVDLTVETSDTVYYVSILSANHPRQRLRLESEDRVSFILPPPKNHYTVIFGLKTKTKSRTVDFSSVPELREKKAVKVLLLTPSFDDVDYRVSGVATAPTGSGGEHFGYRVYTATGFLNYLKRNENKQ